MRVTGVVVVLDTDRRVVVRPVVTVVGAVVGAGVAVAAAAGWRGAFAACKFSLAKIVMPPKLLRVIAAASARSIRVEPISGFGLRGRSLRGRSVMRIGEHPRAARA